MKESASTGTLYLVRHGEAAPLGGTVLSDEDRPLTPEGERNVAAVARALARLDGDVKTILSSPLRRAVQTAEILASARGGATQVKVTSHLAPGFSRRELLAEIRALGTGVSIIAVGHQPDLGSLLSHLVSDSKVLSVAIPPGAVLRISSAHGQGVSSLQWLLSPEALHRLSL
ncbi:MAG TPA: phosphohistidine phosphatase SixA [Bacteroidota bacterium]|nr:phosphohistidine phosphatase SixA [Bacteroidota bacterium]